MKIVLENTTKLVDLVIDGHTVPARIWQGETESGIAVHAYVTRIVPEVHETDPRIGEKLARFELELKRCATPTATVGAIPLRLVL